MVKLDKKKRIKKKYILHPGRRSHDNALISARKLMELYGVDPRLCITQYHIYKNPDSNYTGLIHLYVREDNDYTLPEEGE